jgi:tetratricopeptide (TPR) repeat protein
VTQPEPRFNPFPGLRPFEADEDHLFFGREREIDELLRRLRTTRFLAVVGTSGSGKSSLIRSGLVPSLLSGFMARAGTSWRVATLRPGEDPFRHLAAALSPPDILGSSDPELAATQQVMLDATLGRSQAGLVEAVRLAHLNPGDNVLVVVDQFEELFRFRRSRSVERSRDAAIAFVKVLLEAAKQRDYPIFVVLTMRSDFIGDCMEYPGLPEAVNDGQYLVPRMGRDALRSAITGPVAVGGGRIAPRLVLRLLNDLGDDPDQLPVLQHALMRTWNHWAARSGGDRPLDIEDYEAIGTFAHALSRHAEEAYEEAGARGHQHLVARIFRALTDTFSDPRGVRRPTSVAELAAICEAGEPAVFDVVNSFRRPGRSFLMPPAQVPLTPRSIVDISHESLMRCWERLIAWAQEERTAGAFYVRLSQAAEWHAQGTAGLWRDPELELALRWRKETEPTPAWADRFEGATAGKYERAMAFLDASEAARTQEREERSLQRRRKLQQARWTAAVLGVLLAGAAALAYFAFRERGRATTALGLARSAVDQTLESVNVDPASAGADVPAMTELRLGLLERAKNFSVEFLKQGSNGAQLRKEAGLAHLRLGHVSRMLENTANAEREYRIATSDLAEAARSDPTLDSREALADAWNWLGETLRPLADRGKDAEAAYDQAIELQKALVSADPVAARYKQKLARTYGNRGILRASADPGSPRFAAAEADMRQAMTLLEPLAQSGPTPAARDSAAQDLAAQDSAAQELSRTANNLAALLAEDPKRASEAEPLYDLAIRTHEALVTRDPGNRVYHLELAKFLDNSADRARDAGDSARAQRLNQQAIALLDDLLRPAPSLGIEHADAHGLRGHILAEHGSRDAPAAYEESLGLFEQLERDPAARTLPDFHERFTDLLLNLAAFTREPGADPKVHQLLARAINDYIAHADASLASDQRADAQLAAGNLARLLPELGDADRKAISGRYQELQARLDSRK